MESIASDNGMAQVASNAAVDLAHLARYTLGNRALDIEILGLFLQQAPETVARLDAADAHKAWREAAHSLKGSARGIGAWRLGELAEAAEKSPDWQQPAARTSMLEGLRQAIGRVEAFTKTLG